MSRAGWTVLPERFRQEPVDMRAYDAWQDREGLQGATDACREAWAQWRVTWREARNAELAPRLDEPIVVWAMTRRDKHVLSVARALGAAYGLCHATHEVRALSQRRTRAWRAWRQRCQRTDLDTWHALWRIVDGEPIGLISARFDKNPERLIKKIRKQLQWLMDELHTTTVFQPGVYMKAHSKSSSP